MVVTEKQIIAALIKQPELLLDVDKYKISTDDFDNKMYQYLFWAIDNLSNDAHGKLTIAEIEQWLFTSPTAKQIYLQNNGVELLKDLEELDFPSNFNALYDTFKKEALIRELNKNNIGTQDYYVDIPMNEKQRKIAQKYPELSTQDIVNGVVDKVLSVTQKYTTSEQIEVSNVYEGLDELMEEEPEIGLPLQGDIFNYAVCGAQIGCLYIRSGGSGVGKTRNFVIDAAPIAFPVRYNWNTYRWEEYGFSEKVLYIATEQKIKKIKRMLLAYISGVNEKLIKTKRLSPLQMKIIEQSKRVFEEFQNNFIISRIPDPSIGILKQHIRKEVVSKNIKYVFFDYVFISPNLLSEFKSANLRNDEILLLFSNALKLLAEELEIFIMTGTQLNFGNNSSGTGVKNETNIAGSKAIINKGDVGCIISIPSNEELKSLENFTDEIGIVPNIVTDLFKNREDDIVQVRIWSKVDLGTFRRKDLFITNGQLNGLDLEIVNYDFEQPKEEIEKISSFVKGLNNENK